jgi:hypothetical protein
VTFTVAEKVLGAKRAQRVWLALALLVPMVGFRQQLADLWQSAASWPLVQDVLESHSTAPPVPAGRLGIYYYDLGNDDGSQRAFVRAALDAVPGAVTIHIPYRNRGTMEERHHKARELLLSTGGRLAVWGEAIRTGDKGGVDLFVTLPGPDTSPSRITIQPIDTAGSHYL